MTDTVRPTVTQIENNIGVQFPVLDYGFVRVIDYMGNDDAIVQAARVSYGQGTTKVSTDTQLIRYLIRHSHSSPLEMNNIKLHIKAPIFVARQWIRHRMSATNEYSARYSILDNDVYIPKPEHMAAQAVINNQGRGKVLSVEEAEYVTYLLQQDASQCYSHYIEMLNQNPATGEKLDCAKDGLARELARINLTLNHYTQWYWKIDLHNLFHFLKLRCDSHAQYEIRAYADVISSIVQKWCPVAHQAFVDYKLNAVTLSAQQFALVRALIYSDDANYAMDDKQLGKQFNLSSREVTELVQQIQDNTIPVQCI